LSTLVFPRRNRPPHQRSCDSQVQAQHPPANITAYFKMTEESNSTPKLLYCLYRFTSCPLVRRMYLFGNHGHVCEDCKCIKCVVQRWVRKPHCNCRLPAPRQGLTLDCRIRKKRLACRHEPRSVPTFHYALCLCDNPENRNRQIALANPETSTTNYSDDDSESTKHVEDGLLECGVANSYDTKGRSFGELRKR
jgi:hypothetical protein